MQAGTKIDGRTMLALTAMGMSVFILANDFSAMNVAMPDIEKAFDSNLNSVQWVINAYALVFAMLIVTGGRLADMFGRRKVFFIGAAIFGTLSFLGGLAQEEIMLVVARALMGIGGALMWPAILGMTYAILPKERSGLAGALIIGAAGIGQGAGPIIGGVLTDLLSWRWVLFVNAPICLAAILITWRFVHVATPAHGRERIDYVGIVTLSGGLFALLFALDQSNAWGWGDWRIIASLVLAVVLLAGFFVTERRMDSSALVPGDVVGNRRFIAACIAIGLVGPAFVASLFYLPQFMQKILEFSTLKAGLGMLPMMVLFTGISFASGVITDKLGVKIVVSAGAFFLALGPALLYFVNADSEYVALVPGMIALGIGLGLFYSPATTAAVTALPESQSSLAGGIIYMFQIGGGAIGLGLTTTVFSSVAKSELKSGAERAGTALTDQQAEALQGIYVDTESAQAAIQQFGADVANRLVTIANDAFAAAFQSSMLLLAALSFGAFLVALFMVGGPLRIPKGIRAKLPARHEHRAHRAHG